MHLDVASRRQNLKIHRLVATVVNLSNLPVVYDNTSISANNRSRGGLVRAGEYINNGKNSFVCIIFHFFFLGDFQWLEGG